MKIFEFESQENAFPTDWIYAKDMEDAKEFYMRHTGCIESDLDDINIIDIPQSEWKDKFIVDPNEYSEDKTEEDGYINGYKIQMTFQEYADQNTIIDIICTSEF